MKKEDQNIEYKQSWRDECLKWICGFANANGGRMLIGVTDDRIRRGATNRRLSGPGLEAFLLKRRGLHWENLPCPRLKLKDISAREIKRFKALAIDKGRLDSSVGREAKENFISNLHLVGTEGISYAGALLFTEKAEKWIPGAYIKVGKFGENEADLVYHDDVHGSLIEQAEKTLELIYFKYLKAKIRYENGLHRVEKFPFPREALRELILNALVHKDYSSNILIQISVSNDKLYIANIGSLPDDWTVKRLLGKHSSRPRNPTIAGCVYLTGMIETWGRGIRKVLDECKRHGCPPPAFEVNTGDPGEVQVRIDAAIDALLESSPKPGDSLGETVNETVNETVSELIIRAVENNPGIRRPRLLKLIPSLTLSTLARRLTELSARIEFRGAPKTGGYYIKK